MFTQENVQDITYNMPLKPLKTKDRLEHIKKDPQKAVEFTRKVLKGRWPEAEPFIMKDPRSAYWYARFIIKDRWPEAEPYIMKDSLWANLYAYITKNKDRWP